MQEKIVIALIAFMGGILPTVILALLKKSIFETKLPLEVMKGVTAAEESLRGDLMKQIEELKKELKEIKDENKELRKTNRELEERVEELEHIIKQCPHCPLYK